jgi:hypothetical protein
MPTKQPNYMDLAYYFMVLIIKYRDMNCDKKRDLFHEEPHPGWLQKCKAYFRSILNENKSSN